MSDEYIYPQGLNSEKGSYAVMPETLRKITNGLEKVSAQLTYDFLYYIVRGIVEIRNKLL